MKKSENVTAIIDSVGVKAGMDLYDINLAESLNINGVKTYICSNFNKKEHRDNKFFNNDKDLFFLAKLVDFINGHIKSFSFVRYNNFDKIIMHLFSFEIKDLFVLFLASKIYKLRVILIVHDVSGFANKDNDFVKRIILNHMSKYLVVHNDFSKIKLLNFNTQLINKIRVIKHGNFINEIDIIDKHIAKRKLNLDKDKKILLFFGQIKKIKGLEVLLKSLNLIKNPNVILIIAGKVWEDSFDFYQSLIDELGLEGRVILNIGYIDNCKRDLLFSACDLLVLPYKKIFQSGVLLMAMSNKVPIIASDLDPFKEVIDDENGFTFKSEDCFDLAKKINLVINNEEVLNNVKSNAYNMMKNDYSWLKIAKNYKVNFFEL